MLQKKRVKFLIISGIILLILAAVLVPKTTPFKTRAMKKAAEEYLKNKYDEKMLVYDVLLMGGFLGIGADCIAGAVPVNSPDMRFDVWYEYEGSKKFLADSYPPIYWTVSITNDIQNYIEKNKIYVFDGNIVYNINTDILTDFDKTPDYGQILSVSGGPVLEMDFIGIIDSSNKDEKLGELYKILEYAAKKYTVKEFLIGFYDYESGDRQRMDISGEDFDKISSYTELEEFLHFI